MLSKEEIECCKSEAKDYIEFMETAGDNAGWVRGLLWYIDQLESDNYEQNNIINSYIESEQKLIEKLEERIKAVDKCYNELLTDIGGIKIINVTGLNKKEREEIINKRNCLLVQKHCYEEILSIINRKRRKSSYSQISKHSKINIFAK